MVHGYEISFKASHIITMNIHLMSVGNRCERFEFTFGALICSKQSLDVSLLSAPAHLCRKDNTPWELEFPSGNSHGNTHLKDDCAYMSTFLMFNMGVQRGQNVKLQPIDSQVLVRP